MGDDDPIARLRAQNDQAKEGLKEYAASIWTIYAALVDEGFDTAQALKLTNTFLAEQTRATFGQGSGE